MTNRFYFWAFFNGMWLVVAVLLGGPVTRAGSIGVTVEHALNGNPLRLEQGRYRNNSNEYYTVSRLSYLLSDFALQTVDGRWVALPDQVVWIDEQRNRKNFVLHGVPENRWRALRFYVGPDEQLNHQDHSGLPGDHPLNPTLNRLYRTRKKGFVFLAIEGRWVQGNRQPSPYVFQLADDPMRPRIHLPLALDTRSGAGHSRVRLRFDVGVLFNAPVPVSFERHDQAGHAQTNDLVAHSLRINLAAAFQAITTLPATVGGVDAAAVRLIDLPASQTKHVLGLIDQVVPPPLPPDNPLLVERIKLGATLFFDPRLSGDGRLACVTCHDPDKGFADPRGRSSDRFGATTRRQAMPLTNLAWKHAFGWSGRSASVREEILRQLNGSAQMGQIPETLVQRLSDDQTYVWLFKRAFGSGKITEENVALALENYLLSLTTKESRFDRARRGQAKLTAEEAHGFVLFMTQHEPRGGERGGSCFQCHSGPLFSDFEYHDIGLPALAETVSDRGRAEVTGRDEDADKFVTPSLRQVALTGPYMHDGRFRTLEEVVAHYDHGVVRRPTVDAGFSERPSGRLNLSAEEQAALVAFLKTL